MESSEDATTEAALHMLRRVGGPDLVGRMIDSFLRQIPQRIAAIRGGLESGDLAAVHLASHTLKSSAAQLGAGGLREICADIEAHAGAKLIDDLVPLVERLESEAERVRVRLEEMLRRGRSGE